jgi:hypothetical protein
MTCMNYKPMNEIIDMTNLIAELFQEIPFMILLMACDMLLVVVGSVTKIDYLPLFALIINIMGIGGQIVYTLKS